MMMVMVMMTMIVNVCDDDCYLLVMKVILVKEVMSCDILPVAMFYIVPYYCDLLFRAMSHCIALVSG